jgi:hypothetical protein
METIIPLITLLIAVISLGVTIGIVSRSIHEVDKCRRKALFTHDVLDRASLTQRHLKERLEHLENLAIRDEWLINFLYARYSGFIDLETEVREGLAGVTGDTSVGEADRRYHELEEALRITRIVVPAAALRFSDENVLNFGF